MKKNRESYFWTSYSDLMTSLFFVMLTLFILTIVLLNQRMKATEQELAHIKTIEQSTKDLCKNYFAYNDEHKKYVLKIKCAFDVNVYDINTLSNVSRDSLRKAGDEIKLFLQKHAENNYLLIVEGQASKNSESWTDYNYDLSYRRARALMTYWKESGVSFPNNCETQISGSGDGRLNVKPMRDSVEVNNQRFLIHIIPKNIMRDEE